MDDYSTADFIAHLKQLEDLLTKDFRVLAEAMRNNRGAGVGESQLRLAEQLQYHDIIRQKIEHVRHFMEEREKEPQQNGTGPDAQNLSPELLELSLAILRYSQAEYMEVQLRIKQLIHPSEEVRQTVEQESFEMEIQLLIKKLEKLYLQTEEEEEAVEEEVRRERLRRIWKSFSMESEREVFTMLFDEEEPEEENESPEGQVELF